MKRKGLTLRAMNVTVISGIMVACIGCSGPLQQLDLSQPIERNSDSVGPRYKQNGHDIDPRELAHILALEPEAAPHVSRARTLAVLGPLFAGAGGALVGVPLGQWVANKSVGNVDEPMWTLALVGAVVAAVSIPLVIASHSSMDSAVDAHNDRVAKAKATAPSSTSSWKPGQRAGVPSAFGFVLGTSKADAAAACKKAGHEWSDAEGFSRCTGTPSTAIAGGSAQLEFAEGRLSRVAIVIAPPNDAAGWADTFKKTESAMTEVYGKPTQRGLIIPDDCMAEGSFLGCVADGKVSGSAIWYVDGGYVATLSIVAQPLPSASTLRVQIGRPRANP